MARTQSNGRAHMALWLGIGLLALGPAALAAEGTWATRADMPTARVGFAPCVVDGRIYAIGGARSYGDSSLATVEVYDPKTDTWTARSEMPTARQGLSCSVVNGKVYAIGGAVPVEAGTYAGCRSFSTVEEYDPLTDTWTTSSEMPTARTAHSASVVDGRIYVMGGGPHAPYERSDILAVEVYEPATDTWSRQGDMPRSRASFSTSVVDGLIYAVGGYPAGRRVYAYDPVTDTWTAKADIPTYRVSLHNTCALNGRVYAIGGHRGASPYVAITTAEVYDPATDAWTTAPDMPTARVSHGTIALDGRVYAIGGLPRAGRGVAAVGTVEEYDPDRVVAVGPVAAVAGQPTPLEVAVVLPRSATGSALRVSLDLAPLGSSSTIVLEREGAGTYAASVVTQAPENGQYSLPLTVEPAEGTGSYQVFGARLDVYPARDLVIYDDGPGDGWGVEARHQAESNPASSAFVHTGSASHAITLGEGIPSGHVKFLWHDPAGVDLFGYSHLEFYINGGEASGQAPTVARKRLSQLGVVPQADTWTLVSIPVSALPVTENRLTGIDIIGKVAETFYLDDIRLVAEQVAMPTAVEETADVAVVPAGSALHQNYPNPFNGETVIPFALPMAGEAELTIFSLTGQRVATLAQGWHPAGAYSVRWDGRDRAGREHASGVYLCRLRVGERQVETRKLLLLR